MNPDPEMGLFPGVLRGIDGEWAGMGRGGRGHEAVRVAAALH